MKLTVEAELAGCWVLLQCLIDPRTSGRMDCDFIDVNSAPGESGKESSYFHVHGSHLQVSLAWSFPSPCFGRLCSHAAVARAWLLHSPNVFIVGYFNACPKSNFGELLSDFCLEHELKISDKIYLPVDSFTYVNDTHGTCSWLDHVVSSKSAHDSIQNIEILHQFILSDHRPVAATIKTAALPQNILCDNKTQHEKNMNWNKATQQQTLKYQQASKNWL